MGGIKSYKIHIKLDLIYPLLMEKILITSRINTLQIMYLKAADILKHVQETKYENIKNHKKFLNFSQQNFCVLTI